MLVLALVPANLRSVAKSYPNDHFL
jgi:hypothetical protein